jgi:methionine sulfoxide reductase heme-binding subunit
LPLGKILINAATDTLGYNSIQALHFELGTWALRFLCITLLITPIQLIMKWQGMTPYRQLFGLLTFFYASLHVLAYLWVDHALQWSNIAVDIWESSYLWFGLVAYLIIFLLGITTPVSMKKLLGKKWKKLHRYIYVAAIAALLHYFWQLKGNLAEPLFYSLIVSLELIFRILNWIKNRKIALMMIPGRKIIKDD